MLNDFTWNMTGYIPKHQVNNCKEYQQQQSDYNSRRKQDRI